MSNTAEFDALSVEAKVICGAYWDWNLLTPYVVGFDHPWIIHPLARQGLDDLVAAGYLTSEPLNDFLNCPMSWKPTAKLRQECPKVPRDFIDANGFPMTDESQPDPTSTRRQCT